MTPTGWNDFYGIIILIRLFGVSTVITINTMSYYDPANDPADNDAGTGASSGEE